MFEPVKSNILPKINLLKIVILAVISFISGSLLFWLILSSSHATREQIKMNTASFFEVKETQDLHNISKSILSFKRTFGTDFNIKKNRSDKEEELNIGKITFPFIDKQKVVTCVVSYIFKLIDTDKNQLVDKTEWEKFFSVVDVDRDYQTNYVILFNFINFGQPYNLQKCLDVADMIFRFIGSFISNLTRKDELHLADMIINNKNSYKNFKNMLFQITDRDHDSFITKNEIISLLVTLGLSAKKAEANALQYLDFFSQNSQRIDSQTISREEFNNFFANLRKPLQEGLKTEKAFLRVHQIERELIQKDKQIKTLTVLKKAQDGGQQTEEASLSLPQSEEGSQNY